MRWSAVCGSVTKAGAAYAWRMAGAMFAYLVLVYGTTHFVREHRPQGWALYALALVPTLPMVGMLAAVGLYLKEEADEFQRSVLVRSVLWAVGGTLAVSGFLSFVESYGVALKKDPFTEFVVFWILLGVGQGIQSARNRVRGDD